MNAVLFRVIFWGAIGAILIAGLVYAFLPRPVGVDMAAIGKERVTVAVGDERWGAAGESGVSFLL